MSNKYEVEYTLVKLGPDTKPKKGNAVSTTIWLPGFLITTPSTGWIWLKDATKVTIKKGTVRSDVMSSIVEGGRVSCAGCDIKIIKNMSNSTTITSHHDISNQQTTITSSFGTENTLSLPLQNQPNHLVPEIVIKEQLVKRKASSMDDNESKTTLSKKVTSSETTNLSTHHNHESSTYTKSDNERVGAAVSGFVHEGITVDPILDAVMRPHQREAASFLISKLLGQQVGGPGPGGQVGSSMNDPVSDDDDDGMDMVVKGGLVPPLLPLPLTGAILADDMGTGKVSFPPPSPSPSPKNPYENTP